ncbi:MAG: phenylacetate--CoA ligase family protein [Nitrospiria bacterium]
MIGGYLKAYLLYPLIESMQKRDIRAKFHTIRKDFENPFMDRLRLRKKNISNILKSASANVPYYCDLFRKIGFDPDKIEKDIRYLEEVPYLTKDIIREEGRRLINEKLEGVNLHSRKTGGSTGPSTLIYYNQVALDWTAASNLFVLDWTGKKRYKNEVHLSSRFPDAFPFKDRIKEKIKCMALNRVNIVTDSFDLSSLGAVWSKLRRTKPYLVQAHPSTLYALALFVKERGEKGEGVIKVFESTGEVLDKKKKEVIESVFKCRIFDRYGNAEFGVVAYETGGGEALKVLDFMVYPENYSTSEGHEIVLTGLRNDAMPLIRYRTGDLGSLEIREDGFWLKNIEGRVHELVRIGDKNYPTHYIQDLLDRIGGIDEFQIELRGDRTLLRLVLANSAERDIIDRRIKGWWEKIDVEFTNFDGLKRCGWREKFRHVVS